jgi:hypothetical protein
MLNAILFILALIGVLFIAVGVWILGIVGYILLDVGYVLAIFGGLFLALRYIDARPTRERN